VTFNGALVIREHKGQGLLRGQVARRQWPQVKRRVGAAWLERDATDQWRPPRGRVADGCLDEKSAVVVMNRLIMELVSPGGWCGRLRWQAKAAAVLLVRFPCPRSATSAVDRERPDAG
jgi:hypothetical protein